MGTITETKEVRREAMPEAGFSRSWVDCLHYVGETATWTIHVLGCSGGKEKDAEFWVKYHEKRERESFDLNGRPLEPLPGNWAGPFANRGDAVGFALAEIASIEWTRLTPRDDWDGEVNDEAF